VGCDVVVGINRKRCHFGLFPFTVAVVGFKYGAPLTVVTFLTPAADTSKRILPGMGEDEGIAMKRAQTSAEVLR
jgi:hypothetical protein